MMTFILVFVVTWQAVKYMLPYISKTVSYQSVVSEPEPIRNGSDPDQTHIKAAALPARADPLFLHVFDKIYLSLASIDQAEVLARNLFPGKYILVNINSSAQKSCTKSGFVPSSLAEIFRFDEILRDVDCHNPSHKIVICAGLDLYSRSKSVFLVGSYLLMTRGFSDREVASIFALFGASFYDGCEGDDDKLSISVSWTAIHQAKRLGWIDFGDIFDVGQNKSFRIFIEEYIHYARHDLQVHFVRLPIEQQAAVVQTHSSERFEFCILIANSSCMLIANSS